MFYNKIELRFESRQPENENRESPVLKTDLTNSGFKTVPHNWQHLYLENQKQSTLNSSV